MTALLDTSFLVALSNTKDKHHIRCLTVAREFDEQLLLPVTVLPEVTYLIGSRLGHLAMRRFICSLSNSNMLVVHLENADLSRVFNILEQYKDSRLDFVDATIVAMAERLNVTQVLTLDRRDFSIIRPTHCEHFVLLP